MAARPPRSRPSLRRSQRGSTLIEAMISLAILTIGILGALQGTLIATRQNASADRMQRADAIAQQMRHALESNGIVRLTNIGLLGAGSCTTDSATVLLAGDIAGIDQACVIDFDAFEDGLTAPLVAPYPSSNRDHFRRLIVYQVLDRGTEQQLDFLGVVVSWNELGRPRRFTSFMALHDPRLNRLNLEI